MLLIITHPEKNKVCMQIACKKADRNENSYCSNTFDLILSCIMAVNSILSSNSPCNMVLKHISFSSNSIKPLMSFQKSIHYSGTPTPTPRMFGIANLILIIIIIMIIIIIIIWKFITKK